MAEGWPFFDVAEGPSIFVWVDNIFVAARSEAAAVAMLSDVGAALGSQGLLFKPSSLMLMTCGRRTGPVEGTVPLLERAGRGPAGQALALKRVAELPVLGFSVQADGRPRQELEHQLRRADRAWHALRRTLTSKWVAQETRHRMLSQRLWPLAVPPGAGAWALEKGDVQSLRQWELKKVCQAHRIRHPRSHPDVGAAYRRLESFVSRIAEATGTAQLADAYFGALFDRAAAWSESRNCCQQLWRWAALAGDELGWQAIAPAFQRADPLNRRTWRHSSPGRPRLTWAALVSLLAEGSWTVAVGGSLPSRSVFIARGRVWAGLPTRAPIAPTPAPSTGPVRPRSTLPQPVCALGRANTMHVQLLTDARGLAEAARGCAAAPAAAQTFLRRALGVLWGVRIDGGVEWILTEPIAWIPRDLNAAADFLAGCDAPEGLASWTAPQSTEASLYRLAFSDGALSQTSQGWAACVAERTDCDGWSIRAVRTWRGQVGSCTVPTLEAAGIEAAAQLVADPWAPVSGAQPFSHTQVLHAQGLLRLAWPPSWPPGA